MCTSMRSRPLKEERLTLPATCSGMPPAFSSSSPSGSPAARKAMPSSFDPSADCNTQRTWFSPTILANFTLVAGKAKRGDGFP